MSAAEPVRRPPTAERFRVVGFGAILAIVALRALVAFDGQSVFQVDPAREPLPLLAVGSAGSLLLDLLACVAAGIALVGEHFSGRGLRLPLVALAVVPGLAIAVHANASIDHAFRGDTWLASMMCFAALAHLVREPRLRVVAFAVLVAVAVPMAVRGIVQFTVEHDATVAAYESVREKFLADRGWAADSAAAKMYERRLMQPEATGWFGLSNPYSTFMGVGLVGLGLVGAAAWRAGSRSAAALALVGGLACGGLLAANGGKGALLATGLALVLALVAIGWRRPARANWVLLLAVAAVGVVVVRGAVGEGAGERSLLFRAYYLETGARMLAERPLSGVGPAGVQEAFARLKPVECPEDVISLHSMFVDWVVALGLAALAWVGLVAWTLRGVPDAEGCTRRAAGALDPARLALRIAGIAAVAVLLVAQRVEAPMFDATMLLLRAAGLVAFVMAAAALAQACSDLESNGRLRVLTAACVAAAAVVLVHAMIDMAGWLPGSAMLAISVVALASSVSGGGSRLPLARLAMALPMAAIVLVASHRSAAARIDRALEHAADEVRPLAELRDAVGAYASLPPSKRDAASVLAAAGRVPAVGSEDAPRLDGLRAALAAGDAGAARGEIVAIDRLARQACAARLVELAQREPRVAEPALRAAVEQRAAAALRPTPGGGVAIADDRGFEAARLLAEDFVVRAPGARAVTTRADLAMVAVRGGLVLTPDDARRAAVAVQMAAEMQPSNPRRWRDLGECLRAAGDAPAALASLRRALEVHEAVQRNDPLAGLSDRERDELARAIAALGG